jgi:hypothetical protein
LLLVLLLLTEMVMVVMMVHFLGMRCNRHYRRIASASFEPGAGAEVTRGRCVLIHLVPMGIAM